MPATTQQLPNPMGFGPFAAPPTASRWTHTRHHTDTLVLGRDPEIQAMRPARLARILGNLVGLYDVVRTLRRCRPPKISIRSVTSARTVNTKRSA
jgi:hypothetical protein